jgi:polyisoprenoid-binding protein YceI
MKKHMARLAVLAGIALIDCTTGLATTSTWKIDPRHSAAQFAVRHMAICTVRGAFSNVNGRVQWDEQDITRSTVDVTIDVTTVDTREPARDKDLRGDHFFDVEHFPTVIFKSKKVEQVAPGKLNVTGDLTIRGTTKEVVLDVEGPTLPVKDTWGNQRAAVNATTKINRQDFGVPWNATLDNGRAAVADEVNINIHTEMTKQVPEQ